MAMPVSAAKRPGAATFSTAATRSAAATRPPPLDSDFRRLYIWQGFRNLGGGTKDKQMPNDRESPQEILARAQEAALRAAYEDGFAACAALFQEEFAKLLAKLTPRQAAVRRVVRERPARDHQSAGRTVPRGLTREAVERAYRSPAGAKGGLSPMGVVYYCQENDGIQLAETSVRRAIDHLQKEGIIARVGKNAVWRLISPEDR